ncbi:putative baseplate assembly protein [Glutamicibacter soli]|uniref:Putative baseplate assembly protein n=1 Tax=Glutamicibacter soli TaxID=453836 RepID=A0A6L9G1I7_9MICC|nr:putative baseplate assembly protein [Glutamicibacter soli]NAZ14725.1 putative baseplate assembly protein [Glutamicibacter soli]
MTLPDPHLDTRSFAELMDEARARIPGYTPEWTNFNASDPGMTLVQLHAWLTETILHELDRVPALNYLKFLRLLGVHLRPAYPARTELSFVLAKLDKTTDPLSVPVPLGTQVAVDAPDLPAELVFETMRSLPALNARIGALLVPSGQLDPSHTLVTRYADDVSWLPGFTAFIPQDDAPLYLGLLLRPRLQSGKTQENYAQDRLPPGPLDFYVNAAEANDPPADPALPPGRAEHSCPQPGTRPENGHLRWQVYAGGSAGAADFAKPGGSLWLDAPASLDETGDLARSGHLVLEIPSGATALDPRLLPEELWAAMDGLRPPSDVPGLLDALDLPGVLEALAGSWEQLGVEDPQDTLALGACGASVADTRAALESLPSQRIDPTRISYRQWVQANPDFQVALPTDGENLRALYWFRAVVNRPYTPVDPLPAPLAGLLLNTVPAHAAVTRLDDLLGRTNGRPAQQLSLPRSPVLVDPASGLPDIDIELADDTQGSTAERTAWQVVDDFSASTAQDRHVALDPQSGTLSFGDGLHGLVPPPNRQVIASRWRTGGGRRGNVPPGTVSKIKGRINNVESVFNPRAAQGGSDAQSLDELVAVAPQLLRIGGLAHTPADFAELALRTPGQNFHSAYTLARKVPANPADDPGGFVEKDGAVTVVVLPESPLPRPQPDTEQLRALCAWLEPHRLVTTELHLAGPSYTTITRLSARVGVRPGYDLSAVAEALYAALLEFFHPLRGGPDGGGWPFGYDILHGDVYDVMLAVPGVHRVRELAIELEGTTAPVPDILPLADGHLPWLERSVIAVVSGYE